MYSARYILLMLVMSISWLSYCAEKRTSVKRPTSTVQSLKLAKDSRERKVNCCERIMQVIVCALCVVGLGAKIKADSDQKQEQRTAICNNSTSVNGFTLNSPILFPKINGDEDTCLSLEMIDCSKQTREVQTIVGPFCGNIKYPLQPLSEKQKKALQEKMMFAVSSTGKHIFYWHKHDRLYGFSEGM